MALGNSIFFFLPALDDSLFNFKAKISRQKGPSRNSSNLLLISREFLRLSLPSATVIQVMVSILNSDASTFRSRCHFKIEDKESAVLMAISG